MEVHFQAAIWGILGALEAEIGRNSHLRNDDDITEESEKKKAAGRWK